MPIAVYGLLLFNTKKEIPGADAPDPCCEQSCSCAAGLVSAHHRLAGSECLCMGKRSEDWWKKALTIPEGSCKRAHIRSKGFSVKYSNSGSDYYYWFYYKTGLPVLR